MSSNRSTIATNLLLAALPSEARRRVLGDCSQVDLMPGEILYVQGQPMRYVYFPTTGCISMLTTVDAHLTLEVGMIGSEGMCGSVLALGSGIATLRAIVQGVGSAWRLETATFLKHLECMPALRRLVEQYIAVSLRQLEQASGCLRFHVVDRRLARWLLMSHDRAHSDSFKVTQRALGYMLGTRRAGVSDAAHALQSQKVIRYTRGNLTILNRRRLENAACECYRLDLETYQRGLGERQRRRQSSNAVLS